MVEEQSANLGMRVHPESGTFDQFFGLMGGMMGMVLGIDKKLFFWEKNGSTPNYFVQKPGGTP